MEAFRKKIKRNFVIYCILIAAFAACYILLQMFGGNNFGNRYISGFFSGGNYGPDSKCSKHQKIP